MANVLVFAEHQHHKFPKTTLVAITAGKEAASKSGGACCAVVLGKGISMVSSPPSTSRTTRAVLPSATTMPGIPFFSFSDSRLSALEAKVPCGHPSSAASI